MQKKCKLFVFTVFRFFSFFSLCFRFFFGFFRFFFAFFHEFLTFSKVPVIRSPEKEKTKKTCENKGGKKKQKQSKKNKNKAKNEKKVKTNSLLFFAFGFAFFCFFCFLLIEVWIGVCFFLHFFCFFLIGVWIGFCFFWISFRFFYLFKLFRSRLKAFHKYIYIYIAYVCMHKYRASAKQLGRSGDPYWFKNHLLVLTEIGDALGNCYSVP